MLNIRAYEASEWDLVNGTLFPWPLLLEAWSNAPVETYRWHLSMQHYRNRVTGETRLDNSSAGASHCPELLPMHLCRCREVGPLSLLASLIASLIPMASSYANCVLRTKYITSTLVVVSGRMTIATWLTRTHA